MYSVLRVAQGPSVKLAGCKSALNTSIPNPMVHSTDSSKTVVPMLVLLLFLCGLFHEAICFALCYFVLVLSSPFSIAITLLGEERANLSAFRSFVRFALVTSWFCLFPLPLPLGVWEGLRLVIVVPTRFFSYLFFETGWYERLGPEVIKLFSCSTELSIKFSLVINMKKSTIVGIFIFISREIFMLTYF